MTANCNKCNKPTSTTKEITSKKTGKKYTVLVCQSCMNGQYPYTFFPPKEDKPNGNGGSASLCVQQEILKTVQDIRSLMAVQKGLTVKEVQKATDDFSMPSEDQEAAPF